MSDQDDHDVGPEDSRPPRDPNPAGRGGSDPPPAQTPPHLPHDPHFTFRSGECLIFEADIPLLGGETALAPRLERAPREPRDDTLKTLGIGRWVSSVGDADLPALVEELRTPRPGPEQRGTEPSPVVVPRVFLDHGFYAHWHDWWPHGFYLKPGRPLADLPRRRFPPLPGAGVRVGILDTGVRRGRVEWFAGRVDSRVPDDEDPPANTYGPDSIVTGHGTHLAGIVLQHAPGVHVIVRRVIGLQDKLVHDSDVAVGILALARDGVDIIICAFGGSTHQNLAAPATDLAINEVRRTNPGLIVVASAGNSGVFVPFYPAALDAVIAVGALQAGQDVRTGFSNYGEWVDAAAPGEDVNSTFLLKAPFNGWALWSGTSMAAPKVAAAVARERAPGGWRQYLWFLRPKTARQAAFRLLNDPNRPWDPDVGTVIREDPYVT